jgi:hypothetical protein
MSPEASPLPAYKDSSHCGSAEKYMNHCGTTAK